MADRESRRIPAPILIDRKAIRRSIVMECRLLVANGRMWPIEIAELALRDALMAMISGVRPEDRAEFEAMYREEMALVLEAAGGMTEARFKRALGYRAVQRRLAGFAVILVIAAGIFSVSHSGALVFLLLSLWGLQRATRLESYGLIQA